MTSTTTDHAALYVAARARVYRAKTTNGIGDAIVRAGRVRDAAAAAGVRLDLDALEIVVRELVGV